MVFDARRRLYSARYIDAERFEPHHAGYILRIEPAGNESAAQIEACEFVGIERAPGAAVQSLIVGVDEDMVGARGLNQSGKLLGAGSPFEPQRANRRGTVER